jgi:hypothetical protein
MRLDNSGIHHVTIGDSTVAALNDRVVEASSGGGNAMGPDGGMVHPHLAALGDTDPTHARAGSGYAFIPEVWSPGPRRP